MKKVKALLATAAIGAATLGVATPASATTCAGELGDALCYVIAVVDGSQCAPVGKC